jgi:transaldolase
LCFLNQVKKPIIVSIFCGRIGDTGYDPLDIVDYAVSRFRNNDNIKILWAGCQRVYDIVVAEKSGCDIITVPEGVLKKINRIGTPLQDFSTKTSYDFHMDGQGLQL